ncbi:ABC transporter substrate-binding protein [Sphingobacteriales bacterium UPWRP_1]|nr:hypothetical protein BVG80_15050 [Sphingobacteriales bacterium TSM_CSM]PSJ79066.1 ABC transporter substrate-binding protein [Sphingobacteriales bacterium UPWRP_1]
MRHLFLLLFTAFVAVLLTACGNGNQNTSTSGNFKEAPGNVYYGGTFKVNETEYFQTLYPLNIGEVVGHRIANQIYEGLVRLNQADLSVEPSLATRWTIDPSATVYTFNIRKGVKFHDNACFAEGKGRELTVQDVKYCLDRLCAHDVNNKGYDFVRGRIAGADAYYESSRKGSLPEGGVQGIQVLNDTTLQITLQKPFSSFLYVLAMQFGYIYPKEAVEKYGTEMRQNTVGTGPFYLKTLRENETVVLLRNPNYWGKDKNGNQLPYLDGVKVMFIKDEMTWLREFKDGKFDLKYRLPLEVADEVADASGNLKGEYAKFIYQTTPSLTIQYYGFLNSGKIFNNKKLRQAFCYAIDRQKLVDYTIKGAAVPAFYGIVPPAFTKYNSKALRGYDFNPEKARQLLAEAGYPNAKELPPITLQINSGGKRNEQVAEVLQKMLQENLNVQVKIVQMPWPQHLETVESAKVDFWRFAWIADYPDPENFLSLLSSRTLPENPNEKTYLNTTRYKNPEFDRLFEEGLRTTDETKRNELYLKADQVALDDAAILPLYYDKDQRLLQPYVRNLPQNAMEYRVLREVYFEPEK